MIRDNYIDKHGRQGEADEYRAKLVRELFVAEKHSVLADIPTAFLEGGEGTPIVLLHGPGESAFWWMRVIPDLAEKFRVIVPDLPGHGASGLPEEKLDSEAVLDWLDALITKTCKQAPVLVGHVLGGAIAARYAIKAPDKLAQLFLVDSLGLAPFRPSPLFAFELLRFMMRPTEKSYLRFLPQCMYDVNELSRQMGADWEPFLAYNLACARRPEGKAALKTLMGKLGSPRIPKTALASMQVPVTLIWGRHDRANRLKIALQASNSYGWPLHIIENSRDDPKLEQPKAFIQALSASLIAPLVEKQRERKDQPA